MSKTSPDVTPNVPKRLLFRLASLVVTAGMLATPRTQHALSPAGMQQPSSMNSWHTQGSQIRDREGREIRISGINWSGFETKEAVVGGLNFQDYRKILQTIREDGFNTVRIPFSNQMVENPVIPGRIAFSNASGPINTELRGLNSLQILDRIVMYSGKVGLKVILDNHRSEAGSSAEENGLWYTDEYPESAWIRDWQSLAERYESNSAVIGMDLRNEPHHAGSSGACWDCGGVRDWHLAATRAANAILSRNPRLLIFVEGVDTYGTDTSWWGGNLEGVRRSPVRLSIPGRLVYSVHEYGPAEYNQPWFNGTTSFDTLTALWRRRWAYISEAGTAPVWVGEFGTPNFESDIRSSERGSEGQWFSCLIQFLNQRPAIGWTYWGVNGEDRYGLLGAGYSGRSANALKIQALRSIQTSDSLQGLPGDSDAVVKGSDAPKASPPSRPRIATSTAFSRPDSTAVDSPKSLHVAAKAARPQAHLRISPPDEEIQHAIAKDVREATRVANRRMEDAMEAGDR